MNQLDAWRNEITRLTTAIETRWPPTRATLEAIRADADSIHRYRPLAEHYHDPGDGLRSPDTQGGSHSKGAHSDPVLAAVEANSPTYQPGSKRPADILRHVDAQRGNAITWLNRTLRTPPDADDYRWRRLREARSQLAEARSTLHQLLPPPSPPGANLTRTGDPGCASCRRARNITDTGPHYVPTRIGERGRTQLCHWCEKRTIAARTEWITQHPGQQPPADRRFWPPLKAIEWRRDEGNRRISADDWATWEAEEKAARKAKSKGHKRAS